MLQDPAHWIWDSWIADDGERYHLFFLKAPAALKDPALRHEAAFIGHASSTDLVRWEPHEDALTPAEHGFDDLALWTGSAIKGDDGLWRLFYTALNSEHGHGVRDQRIGVATSPDLHRWTRSAGELVVPDPALYRTLGDETGASETWRDPFVFRTADGVWHMLITARAPDAPRLQDGVLGHATSTDLHTWELQPPLTEPAGFGQLEVPQLRRIGDRWLLVFTCHPEEQSESQQLKFGSYCTWMCDADSPLGPFDIDRAKPFLGDPKLFAAPLVQDRDGAWVFIGFRNTEPEGVLSFHIIDPIPLHPPERG